MEIEKRKLGNTGLMVSFLGFGALEIGRDWGIGEDRSKPSDEEAYIVLNGVLDAGINLIDTARAYHRSEERIGNSIAHRRKEYVLASKCGEHSSEPTTYYDFSYDAVKASIDTSLRLLKTDCIDIMQIHFGPNPKKVLDDGETVRAMKDARAEGKVRFLGASCGLDVLGRCIESGDFDVLQVGYSLLDRSCEDLIAKAADRGIGILVRGGLGTGRLTSRVMPLLERDSDLKSRLAPVIDLIGGPQNLPQLALQFLRMNPAVSSVLAGSKRLSHVMENIEALQKGMNPELVHEAMKFLENRGSARGL